jgi:hypothetical protein
VIVQRLHPKDAYPGTGIGLAMCRKIVEYHGGRIWLDTDVPSGTAFRFTLPRLEPDLDTELTESPEPTASTASTASTDLPDQIPARPDIQEPETTG